MKKNVIKHLAFALTLSLVTPTLVMPNNTIVVEAAKKTTKKATKKATKKVATPKLNVTSLTFSGLNDTETLSVLNPVAGARFSWSSTKSSVATVNYKGDVTPVGKGTAVIKCRVYYPNKSQKVLSCVVKVAVPAVSIAINNEKLGDNKAHQMIVGEKYDFNYTLTPAGSSYWGYWEIDKHDSENASVDKYGVVTAKKIGFAKLRAIAASNYKTATTSLIDDAITISIVDKITKTAKVNSVTLASGKELVINFDNPIDASSVINTTTKELKDTIRIYRNVAKDVNSVDPGKLTGTLSKDLKTLTITPTYTFSGTYDITVTNGVRTTEQVAVTSYVETIALSDKTGPTCQGTVLDDSGLTSLITFSEPIDTTNLEILDVLLGNSAPSASTVSILKNKGNYVLSADKKTLKIDLKYLPTTEQNKEIKVLLSGIKDLAGNYSNPYIIPVSLITNTSPKPQARIMNIKRSSYNILSVQYDRAIKTLGVAMVGGYSLPGQIDSEDNKIVNYTLNSQQSALRGNQEIQIGYWDSYNVPYTDTSANTYMKINVNFDVDNGNPYIVEYKLEPLTVNGVKNYNLVLTYNETVTLNTTSGVLMATVNTTNGNILPNTNLTYNASVNDRVVTITFPGSQLLTGNYTTTIPTGFVKDVYFNASVAKDVTFSQSGAYGAELPAPTSIVQSISNPSEILITFASKLDKISAETVTNYSIPGMNITQARLTEQTDTRAVVTLTLQQSTIKYTASYPIILSGIKGYNDSYTGISNYQTMISLKENAVPYVLSAKLASNWGVVEITFSEDVKGTPRFLVYQNGKLLNIDSTSSPITISGNKIYVTLLTTPNGNSGITVVPTSGNYITDSNGNIITIPMLNVY